MTALALPRVRGMPWVTWRQHRVALAGVVVLLGGFALFFLVNGLAMHHDWASLGLNRCPGVNDDVDGPSCSVPLQTFSDRYQGWAQFLPRFLEFVPAAIGMFVGAPLVARELETGTFRLAWTQGTHRVRWVAMKLGLLGAVLTLLALGFSAEFGWWFGPWHSIMGRMGSGEAYEVEGLVFAARTLFGFLLGALLGTVIRRTVPAMAATAAVWLAVAWPSTIYLRPLIEQPVVARAGSPLGISVSWVTDDWFQDATGHHLSGTDMQRLVEQARASGVTDRGGFNAYLANHHITEWVSYQPDSRFWHFQIVEASAYVVAALLLGAATVWLVNRRAA